MPLTCSAHKLHLTDLHDPSQKALQMKRQRSMKDGKYQLRAGHRRSGLLQSNMCLLCHLRCLEEVDLCPDHRTEPLMLLALQRRLPSRKIQLTTAATLAATSADI